MKDFLKNLATTASINAGVAKLKDLTTKVRANKWTSVGALGMVLVVVARAYGGDETAIAEVAQLAGSLLAALGLAVAKDA